MRGRTFFLLVGIAAVIAGVVMVATVAPSVGRSCQAKALADAVVWGTVDDCSSAGVAFKWLGWALITIGALVALYAAIVRPSTPATNTD